MHRFSLALLLVVVAAFLSACGEDEPETGPEVMLTFSVTPDQGAKAKTAELICPGRSSKEQNTCAALQVVAPRVFEPVPVDQACTMIFGGPETATITGTYDGEQVDATFNRSNGCEIARWKQIEPALEALGLT